MPKQGLPLTVQIGCQLLLSLRRSQVGCRVSNIDSNRPSISYSISVASCNINKLVNSLPCISVFHIPNLYINSLTDISQTNPRLRIGFEREHSSMRSRREPRLSDADVDDYCYPRQWKSILHLLLHHRLYCCSFTVPNFQNELVVHLQDESAPRPRGA